MNFEAQVLKDNSLSGNDSMALLKAASVARYSAYYWTTSPQGKEISLKNILKWGAMVAGDVTGILATGNVEDAADCSEAMYYLVDTYMN